MSSHVIDRKKLSSYSAILAILVVLIHTENIYSYTLPEGNLISSITRGLEWSISGNLARIGVPSFFMISGILFYRDFTISSYPKKLKSRFFTLMIPYFIWNLFRFVLLYVLGKAGITEKYLGAPRLIFDAENFINAVFFYKNNLGFWFMYQLILFTILAPVIRLLTKNKWVGLVAIISLIALYSTDVLGELLTVTLEKKFILLDSFIYYLIGAYVGTHFFDVVNKKSNLIRNLSIIGIILGQALNLLFIKTDFLGFYIVSLIVSSVSFWYVYDYIKMKPLPAAVTTITFFIYAAHGTVLEFLQIAGGYIFPDTPITALLTYIFYPVIVLAVLVGMSILFKKMPRFWKLINGSR